jgi:TldD protein
MTSTLVEQDILQRVLGDAMSRGAEFAEVFVEDRTTSSATLDQRRVEELSSGRDRGAGIRVVVGETTGFAHTADLSEQGLLAAAQAAAAVARGGGGGVHTVALGRPTNYPTHASILPGED